MANNDSANWTIQSLKDYTDSKFQTIERAADEARKLADKTLQETIHSRDSFLSKVDYTTRHQILEDRLNSLSATPWTTYAAVGMLLIAILGGFWLQVENRFITLEKRDTELREEVLKYRVSGTMFRATIERLDQKNIYQDKEADTFMAKETFAAWIKERDRLLEQIIQRIDKLYIIIERQNDSISELKAKSRL